MYKKSFHTFQKKYISDNKNSLRMRDLFREYQKDKNWESILDVGCGSGIDLSFFNSLGFKKSSGIDITGSLVDIARKENPDSEIIRGSFLDLEWQNNSFDVVWSKYALQVEQQIEKSISEIYRVTKKNGYVFLQITHPFRSLGFSKTGNYFSEEKIVYPSDDGQQEFVEHHITLTTWMQEVLKNNFQILHFEEILNKSPEKYSGKITPSAFILILKKI